MNEGAKIGDKAFQVEWCYEIPKIPGCDDYDMDKAKYKRVYFGGKSEAIQKAHEVLEEDFFGAVMITPVELTDPHAGTRYAGIRSEFKWETTGESEEFSHCRCRACGELVNPVPSWKTHRRGNIFNFQVFTLDCPNRKCGEKNIITFKP